MVFISIDLLFVEMRTPYKVVYGIKFGYHLTPCFTISPISTTWLDIFLVQKFIFCVFLVVKVVKLLLNVWIRSFIRRNCVAMLLDQLILYLLKWTDRMRDKSGSRWWILKISVRALVVFQSWLNHCGYKGTAFDVAIWPSPDALTHMVHIHLVQNFRGCCLLNSYIVMLVFDWTKGIQCKKLHNWVDSISFRRQRQDDKWEHDLYEDDPQVSSMDYDTFTCN